LNKILFIFDYIEFYLLEIAGLPRFSGLHAVRDPATGLGILARMAARMVNNREKSGALPGARNEEGGQAR
jgi:hypothetical protein